MLLFMVKTKQNAVTLLLQCDVQTFMWTEKPRDIFSLKHSLLCYSCFAKFIHCCSISSDFFFVLFVRSCKPNGCTHKYSNGTQADWFLIFSPHTQNRLTLRSFRPWNQIYIFVLELIGPKLCHVIVFFLQLSVGCKHRYKLIIVRPTVMQLPRCWSRDDENNL